MLTIDTIRGANARMVELLRPPPGALRIQTTPYLTERRQFRFPRSKTRRIRKKWSKRHANFRSGPATSFYLMNGNTVVCHPAMLPILKAKLARAALAKAVQP